MSSATLDDLRAYAATALDNSPPGAPLAPVEVALIRLGVAASVTALDCDAIDKAINDAMDAGAAPVQIQEVVSLVSGLGVHSLMATAVPIARACGLEQIPLSADQQALWDKHVGNDPFWRRFEAELPGFLGAMLRLSPTQFSAFFDYCAVPWKSGQVPARLNELIAMACDATPAHRFGPGFRLHLRNAIMLGAGSLAVGETLDIAAAAPVHPGWR
jgi:alkylhydroperoxidase/carboxymuconolactone decarboxylase family protein YurZ